MKLRNKAGYLNVLPEGTPPKKNSIRVVTFLYLFVLLVIGVYLTKYVVGKFLFVSARGQVEVTRHLMSCGQDGVLKKYFVAVGDAVDKGDVVATVYQQDTENFMHREMLKVQQEVGVKQEQIELLQQQIQDWITEKDHQRDGNGAKGSTVALGRDILEASYRMANKQAQLEVLRHQLERSVQGWETDHLAWSLLLELKTRTDKDLMAMQKDISELQDTIFVMEKDIGALDALRDRLFEKTISDLKEQSNRLQGELSFFRTYLTGLDQQMTDGSLDSVVRSPHTGIVSMLFKQPGAYCQRGESLLSLQPRNPAVTINGFFDINTLGSLKPGKEVIVRLPDKKKSAGRIAKVYSTALPAPQLIEKRYMPIEVEVKAEITPLHATDGMLWKYYDQMDVVLRVRR